MTPEEKLALLLRSDPIPVNGDGLARIQQRVARRRSRRFLVPGAALVTVGAAASFFLLSGNDSPTTLKQVPGPPSPSVAPTTAPTAAPAVKDQAFPAVWPFHSSHDAADWKTSSPWADDELATAKHFASDYLSLKDVTFTQTCVSCEVVGMTRHGNHLGDIELSYFQIGQDHVFTVVDVAGTDLTITSPRAGASARSPLTVTGRITGVDESVSVGLTHSNGLVGVSGSAPAGTAQPWTTTIVFPGPSWDDGAIVARTRSAKDGQLNRITVIPISHFAPGGPPSPSYVAVVGGHVSQYDVSTGKVLRQLTYPPTGYVDSEPAYESGRLVWVRRAVHGVTCGGKLLQLQSSTASTLVASGASGPHLSVDGRSLAYTSSTCQPNAQPTIVVTGPHPQSRQGGDPNANPTLVDIRDDGTLLLLTVNGLRTDKGLAFPNASGCAISSGAFDGAGVIAWESCSEATSRLVGFDGNGTRGPVGPFQQLATTISTSLQDGRVLVVGPAYPDAGAQVLLTDLTGTVTKTLSDDGSVTSATW